MRMACRSSSLKIFPLLASCSATSSTPSSLLLTSSRTLSPSTNSKIGYSRSTGENFRNRTCCTYGVIVAILLWTNEPNERASLCTSRVPTRAEAPRYLTLYDGSVPRQYRRGTDAATHHLL